jgi:prepilin-type N-terminal cleavage/methylation domain-containing protein
MAVIRQRERGFTLIEVMIVVALIAILAAIVIPSFFTEASRAKGDAEVASIFSELRVRQEQYKVEQGAYLSTGADENDTFPASPSPSLQAFQSALPAEWVSLRFASPQPEVRCAYVAIAGSAGDSTGAMAQTFGMAATPSVSWYYLLAHCDMDGVAGDSYYFTSSMDTRIQDQNSGH